MPVAQRVPDVPVAPTEPDVEDTPLPDVRDEFQFCDGTLDFSDLDLLDNANDNDSQLFVFDDPYMNMEDNFDELDEPCVETPSPKRRMLETQVSCKKPPPVPLFHG